MMSKSQEHFNPDENNLGLVDDSKLAEGMAYAEKPYREESARRVQESQQQHDHVYSDQYRDERREIENMDIEERLEEYDIEKQQQIRDRFKRRFGKELSITDEELDELIGQTQKIVEDRWVAEAQRREEWNNQPIQTGISKAEDFRRTYLRRIKQQPMSEEKAFSEASLVKERSREEKEIQHEYSRMIKDLMSEAPRLDRSQIDAYFYIRNWLNRPIDEQIKANDYEEALEYIERLKEVPFFNLVSWLQAQVKLKSLEIKANIRKYKEEQNSHF